MKIITSEYILDVVAPMVDGIDDDAFFNLCHQNELVNMERDENREIIIKPLDDFADAMLKDKIAFEVARWNMQNKYGVAVGSNAGFTLPDSSVRSPDAAWMSKQKWNGIDKGDREKFAHISPDFVIELMSPSDNQPDAKAKMQKWIQNGVLLAWLIDPKTKETFVYRADGTINKIEGFSNTLGGENVLLGFEFDLRILEE